MKQRPILMSGPLVREIFADNKNQTRRPIKNEHLIKMPDHWQLTGNGELWDTEPFPHFEFEEISTGHIMHERSKYGKPKDQFWVRESWQHTKCLNLHTTDDNYGYVYRADQQPWEDYENWTWSPSIFMPKEACRLFLEIQEIRVERLQDISEQDAKAEGVKAFKPNVEGLIPSYRVGFFHKWIEIYGKDTDTNPWVWKITFNKT